MSVIPVFPQDFEDISFRTWTDGFLTPNYKNC
jgi:hypothetical protein